MPDWTATPRPLRFVLQPGSPAAVGNFAHPTVGCQWMGVGGQVFDAQGQPEQSVIVELGGDLAGTDRRALAVTGSAPVFGPAGYEFELALRPLGSQGTLWVQIFDLNGQPLSERVSFDTFDDCHRNLILINFIELPVASARNYLPLIPVSR